MLHVTYPASEYDFCFQFSHSQSESTWHLRHLKRSQLSNARDDNEEESLNIDVSASVNPNN
jgi:hypothetical protein